MHYRRLGRTGLKVSEICLGNVTFGAWRRPGGDDAAHGLRFIEPVPPHRLYSELVNAMAVMPISEIEQAHKDEWLLIRVTETDDNGDPKRGELLFHSADRDEHDRFMLEYPGDDFLMTTYTGKPRGVVILFGRYSR